jgi:hypothetical protein
MHMSKYVPFLVLSFVLVALWHSVPFLDKYSLQLVALSFLMFVGLRFKHNRENLMSLIPNPGSSEIIPITIVCMLLISATGNTHSWIYPLTYVYLVMSVFSLDRTLAIIAATGTLLLQAFLVQTFTPQEMIILINIPVITAILLFAKQQHEKASIEKTCLKKKMPNFLVHR